MTKIRPSFEITLTNSFLYRSRPNKRPPSLITWAVFCLNAFIYFFIFTQQICSNLFCCTAEIHLYNKSLDSGFESATVSALIALWYQGWDGGRFKSWCGFSVVCQLSICTDLNMFFFFFFYTSLTSLPSCHRCSHNWLASTIALHTFFFFLNRTSYSLHPFI